MCVTLMQQMVAECSELEGADEVLATLKVTLSFAKAHLEVIKKWGRFPHRNEVLGRSSTEKEQQGLANGSITKFG